MIRPNSTRQSFVLCFLRTRPDHARPTLVSVFGGVRGRRHLVRRKRYKQEGAPLVALTVAAVAHTHTHTHTHTQHGPIPVFPA